MVRPYYLLDTNVISEPAKLFPAKNVLDKIKIYAPYSAIPAIAWYEALFGMKRLADGRRKDFYSKNRYTY